MSSEASSRSTPPERGKGAKGGASYIPSLDGIRAAACLLVFFGHALPVHMSRIIPPGFGVTVFFLLSGYLITTLLRQEFDSTGDVSLRNFYLRRALRILPPFYIILVLTTILTQLGALYGKVSLASFAAYALHVANYWHIFHGMDDIPGGTSVYWSLSVEEHFYLVFPLLYWTMRRWNLSAEKQLAVVLGLCAAVMFWRVILVGQDVSADRLFRATDTRVDTILFGCALAIYGNPVLDRSRYSDAAWKYVGLPFGLVLLAVTFIVVTPIFHGAIKLTLQAIALLPFFIVAIRCPTWGPFRLLNTRPARFIGLLSYTFYLSHRAVLAIFHTHSGLSWPVILVLALAITIAWSYAMQVFVEAPCARLRRRFSSVHAAPAAPVIVPAT